MHYESLVYAVVFAGCLIYLLCRLMGSNHY